MKLTTTCAAIALSLGLGSAANAAIVRVAHYGLGEAGTISGDRPQDDINSNHFTADNWTTTSETSGVAAPGSTNYLQKTGGSEGTSGTNLGLTDNWAVQIWMNTQNDGGTIQFLTNNDAATGLGVWFQNTGDLKLSTGAGSATALAPGTTYVKDTWYRVGIVRYAGTNNFYVDGANVGSESTVAAELDNMLIGYGQGGTNGGAGKYDELNVWSFDSSDSLASVETTMNAIPEPSAAALLGLGGLALILRRRK